MGEHIENEEGDTQNIQKINKTKSSPNTTDNRSERPFVSHLSLDAASKLSLNDKVDFRDFNGCFHGAEIVEIDEFKGCKIKYIEYSDEYNVWSNPEEEPHRFAEYQSISKRKSHRMPSLKKGDFVDINPNSLQWKIGEIVEFHGDFGQVLVISIDHNRRYELWWIHGDDMQKIQPLQTKQSSKSPLFRYESVKDNIFLCIHCKAKFANYAGLKQHVLCHSERPFVCKYCPDSFKEKHHRSNHEEMHSLHGRYKCNLCWTQFECHTSFKEPAALSWHKKRIHDKTVKTKKVSECKRKKSPNTNTNKTEKRKCNK